MSFKIIDIIFIIIILLMGFAGLKRGFFTQIITIIGVVLGLFLAYFFFDDLSPYMSEIIGKREINNLLSFILILVVTILLAKLFSKVLSDAMSQMGAEGVDKVLGLLFGFVQGLLVCIALTGLLMIQPLFDPTPIFNESILGAWLVGVLPQIREILPDPNNFLNNVGSTGSV